MTIPSRSSDAVFRFDAFEADLGACELRKGGTRLKIQEQPWQVLVTLLEHAGQVVTREELRERLWPTDTFVDFEHGLNIAMNKVRDALDDDAAKPRFVETLPRRGYRFIAAVERIGVQAATPATTSQSTPPLRKSRALVTAPQLCCYWPVPPSAGVCSPRHHRATRLPCCRFAT